MGVVAGVFLASTFVQGVPRTAMADASAAESGNSAAMVGLAAGDIGLGVEAIVPAITMAPLPKIPVAGGPSFMQRFDEPLENGGWYKADFVYESQTQRAGWSKEHVIETGDELVLKITREPKEFQPYTGAEINRTKRYHYGRYQVVMRAAPGSGLVSSFFTHTDDYFGDPHNEIDFEFLGYDTAMVQLNFYSGNGNMQGHLVDLPYDAAKDYQLYTFDWMPDRIDWFIGDQHVFRATQASTGLKIPDRPSRLMMNLWSGSERQYNWHGKPTFESGATASYRCVSYQAPGDNGSSQCSDWFEASVPRLGEAEKADAKH